MFLHKENALILGAGGALGSMLRCYLNNDANIFSFQSRKPIDKVDLIWDPQSSSFDELSRFIISRDIKKVVLLYGGPSSSNKQDKRDLEIIETCFKVFIKTSVDRVLVSSSSAVYSLNPNSLCHEDDLIENHDGYRGKKYQLELIAQKYNKYFNDLCILRIGNVLGADSLTKLYINNPSHFFTLNKYTNGFLNRSYITPVGLSFIIENLLNYSKKLPTIINIAAIKKLSMEEILLELNVKYAEKSCASEGVDVLLDIGILESVISIPRRFTSIKHLTQDLMNYSKWIKG
jgi:UDP-glucose 4-epimerase